jgi:AraC-like DNA-binding protein
MPNTVWGQLVKIILDAAASANFNVEALLTAVELDSALLEDIDARFPQEKLAALWQELVRSSGEESIGLYLAELARPATVINYACASSPNFSEALSRLVRYNQLIYEAREFTLETDGKLTRVTHTVPNPYRSFHPYYQFVSALIVLHGRKMTGRDLTPQEVSFQYPQPTDLCAHRRFFRAPLRFGQPVNEIVFDTGVLHKPLVRSDSGLLTILDRYVEKLLARLPQAEGIVDRVRQALSVELRQGQVSLESTALILEVEPRTLQRRLREAGTSYQAILDEMRRELSIYYLREEQIAVYEVAFLLGFSETGVFNRAFKRWTGQTPSEFRQCDRLNHAELAAQFQQNKQRRQKLSDQMTGGREYG